MTNLTTAVNTINLSFADQAVSHLRQEYLDYQRLFQMQYSMVQRFIESQSAALAEAMMQDAREISFFFPDQVVLRTAAGEVTEVPVPGEYRRQTIGGFRARLAHMDLRTCLREKLTTLEHSFLPTVAVSASLLHYGTAEYLVHSMLPAGKTVRYRSVEGEEIPSIPVDLPGERIRSEIKAPADGLNEGWGVSAQPELVAPYVKAAQRFYLPQWVAFDELGRLLVNGESEAEAHLESMKNYLSVLHAAAGLAPYMVADEEYQQKRYGMLGQLVNQGRSLAHYEVLEIIRIVRERAVEHSLDRGLSLSLPYFNDQTLALEAYNLDVIPAGRVMFVPAFLVLAVRQQAVKVAQDTRFNQSTRKYLLVELSMLEQAFLRS